MRFGMRLRPASSRSKNATLGRNASPRLWAVRNQWPEGTGPRAVDGALVENEATAGDDSAGDPDVIMQSGPTKMSCTTDP